MQGRLVYAHKVLRSVAIRAVYSPGALAVTAAQGATAGGTKLTVTGASGTLKYTKNPASRAVFGAAYGGTALTSGTTEIADCAAGDVIEVAEIVSSKVKSVGYITLKASEIKA